MRSTPTGLQPRPTAALVHPGESRHRVPSRDV